MSSTDRLQFVNELDLYLESLIPLKGENILCGDLNVHVENNEDINTVALHSVTKTYGYTQLVNDSTHRDGGTLDLVFMQECGMVQLVKQSLFVYDLCHSMTSDHKFIEYLIPFVKDPVKPKMEWRYIRNYKNINIEKFGCDMKELLESSTVVF